MTGQHSKQPSFMVHSAGAHRRARPSLRSRIFRPLTVAMAVSALAGAGIAAAGGSLLGGAPVALNHAGDGPVSPLGGEPGANPRAGGGGDSRTPSATRSPTARSSSHSAPPSPPSPSPSPPPSPSAAHSQRPAEVSGYANPLRAVSNLLPERIDMGVDFGGEGPVYALGDAVITSATGSSAGWPGGGWITYRLTSGRDAGLSVYLAEDVRPTVTVGQRVSSSTVIADMFNGGAGIETGWAMPDGSSAESQLPVAGGISGGGPFPTVIGLNFEEMLQKLGVATAPNRFISPSGLLPAGYASW
ncbi:MAG TPA: hypothetical protein VFQ44_13990 [Streptosporangiaceae bacterium]|nr:hypothetical protein [Streptosporangiaceae bacterium]